MAVFFLVYFIIIFAFLAFYAVCYWKLYVKAGKPGWACLVPFYNRMVMLEIGGQPSWHMIMFFIPLVNIYFSVTTLHAFVKSFGKDTMYTVGLIFLPIVFLPMLAFDKNTVYVGPGGAKDEVQDYIAEQNNNTPTV
jgi:hypothetical protein